METPWLRLLVITVTLVGAYAIGRLLGRWFGLTQDKQLWITFTCFLLALLIEGIIYGGVGPSPSK